MQTKKIISFPVRNRIDPVQNFRRSRIGIDPIFFDGQTEKTIFFDDGDTRKSLQGISQIFLIVESYLNQELDTIDLYTDIVEHLQAAGINLINEAEIDHLHGTPLLHLIPMVSKSKKNEYFYTLMLNFCQHAFPVHMTQSKEPIPYILTWQVLKIALTANLNNVYDDIYMLLDKFIDA